jgi:hypothetical protein
MAARCQSGQLSSLNPHPARPACSWTIPSNIGVPSFGGQSLFGLLTQSIGEELAHFPAPPALADKFWCVSQSRRPPAGAMLPGHALRPRGGCSCGSGSSSRASHSPTAPPLSPPPPPAPPSSPRRLYLLTWHVGLFVTLLLGQVGVQGGGGALHCLAGLHASLHGQLHVMPTL